MPISHRHFNCIERLSAPADLRLVGVYAFCTAVLQMTRSDLWRLNRT